MQLNILSLSKTRQYLDELYPASASISAAKAGVFIGFAESTSRNKINSGTFPIQTFLLEAKRMVLKEDVITYLERKYNANEPAKSKRGRPKKKMHVVVTGSTTASPVQQGGGQ